MWEWPRKIVRGFVWVLCAAPASGICDTDAGGGQRPKLVTVLEIEDKGMVAVFW